MTPPLRTCWATSSAIDAEFDREYRILRKDTGDERWVHGRGELVLDRSGRPVRMLGTIADITEERLAQDALRRSELLYAAIFEGTAEAILIAELATRRFRWVNPAACTLLGYDRAELIGLAIDAIHPAADVPFILGQLDLLTEGETTFARSARCVRKDGTILLVDIRGSLATIDGQACTIGFFTDMTELRRLETQDRKLAQAIEQTTEAVLITDRSGEIEYANLAFKELNGLALDQPLVGNANALGSLPSPAAMAAVELAITQGSSWSGPAFISRPDGTERQTDLSVSSVRDEAGTDHGRRDRGA